VFGIDVTGPLANAELKAQLPPALPKALVAGLAQTLPATDATAVQAAVAAAPGPVVPLSYLSTNVATAWVDADTGVVLDQKATHQGVLAEVTTASGPVELLPVADLALTLTPDSTTSAVDKANTADAARSLLGVTGPLGLLGLAVALGGLALWLRRRATAPAPAGAAETAQVEAPTEA
jgi:hypothetical protein